MFDGNIMVQLESVNLEFIRMPRFEIHHSMANCLTLSMFVDGWTKVAMGNACAELKAKADFVTTDVDKDGIWNACVYLGLINGEKL